MTDARIFNESVEVLDPVVSDLRVFNESVEALVLRRPDRVAPTYVGQVSTSLGTGVSSFDVNVAVPGLQAGDLIIVWCQDDRDGTSFGGGVKTWSGPGGWTKLGQVNSDITSDAVFYKFAVGGETTATFTTDSAITGYAVFWAVAYRGVDTTSPVDTSMAMGWGSPPAVAGDLHFPSLPAAAGQLRVGVIGASVSLSSGYGYIRWAAPTGWTSRINGIINDGSFVRGAVVEWADVPVAADGSTGEAVAAENDTIYGGSFFEFLLNGRVMAIASDTLGTTDSAVSHVPVMVRQGADTLGTTDATVGTSPPPPALIDRIRISFYVTHTYDSDLIFTLLGPSGVISAVIVDEEGGSGADFGSGTDDASRMVIDSASTHAFDSPPFVGTYAPEHSLAFMQGLSPSTVPNWTLHIVDTAGGDVGMVYAASIIVTVAGDDTRYDGVEPPIGVPDNNPTGTTIHFVEAAPPPPPEDPPPVVIEGAFEMHQEFAAEYLEALPAFLREDPDVVAVAYACEKMNARIMDHLDIVSANLLPGTADELTLAIWETLFGIRPGGLDVPGREATIQARNRVTAGGAIDWVAALTALIGAGWSFQRHVYSDGGVPQESIRVTLPTGTDTDGFQQAKAFLNSITDANTKIIFQTSGGFILDAGALDVDSL